MSIEVSMHNHSPIVILVALKYVDQFKDEVGLARVPGVLLGDKKENGEVEGDSLEATL